MRIGSRLVLPCNTELTAIKTIYFLTGSISHDNKYLAFIVPFGRGNEARTCLGPGVDMVREMTPNDIACRWFWPPTHQALSASKRLLRTVPPWAFGADFLSLLS